MFGENIGALGVYSKTSSTSGLGSKILSYTTSKGQKYRHKYNLCVFLPAYTSVLLRWYLVKAFFGTPGSYIATIEAVRGDGEYGDIAIDDIIIPVSRYDDLSTSLRSFVPKLSKT